MIKARFKLLHPLFAAIGGESGRRGAIEMGLFFRTMSGLLLTSSLHPDRDWFMFDRALPQSLSYLDSVDVRFIVKWLIKTFLRRESWKVIV